MKDIVITGGANGIGYYLSWYFLQLGHRVTILDIDELALYRIKNEFNNSSLSGEIHTFVCDVSYKADVQNWFYKNLSYLSTIDLLINNAGIGCHKSIINSSSNNISDVLRVNFNSAIHMIEHILPYMIKNKSGHIVNVCSGQVWFNLPTWSIYTLSKAALASYSEALYHELKPYNINVTTVYPFMVNTGFYNKVETKTLGGKLSMKLLPYYSMTPEKTAKVILKAIQKKKRREIVSWLNYIGQIINLLPPVSNVVGRLSNFILNE